MIRNNINNIKELIAYIFATVSLFIGFGLVIAGFIVDPTGEIHGSVQWVLGECLIFTASVLGISLHIKNELSSMKDHLHKHIDDRFNNLEEND